MARRDTQEVLGAWELYASATQSGVLSGMLDIKCDRRTGARDGYSVLRDFAHPTRCRPTVRQIAKAMVPVLKQRSAAEACRTFVKIIRQRRREPDVAQFYKTIHDAQQRLAVPDPLGFCFALFHLFTVWGLMRHVRAGYWAGPLRRSAVVAPDGADW